MRRLTVPLLFVASVLSTADLAAQTGNRFGGRGPVGQTGRTGTPTLGGPTLGQSGLGAGAGAGFGASPTAGGLGGASGGLGGSQLGSTVDGFGSLGQTIGQGTFVGQGDSAGRFVGNRTSGAAGTSVTGQAGFSQGLSPGLSRGLNVGRGQGQNTNVRPGGQGGGGAAITVRPVQRIGFTYETPGATDVATRLSTLINRRPSLAGVTVVADGERFILRGEVASEETRELAAAVVRLEPGVREVVNELTVAAGPTP